jgi:hypothetical protein
MPIHSFCAFIGSFLHLLLAPKKIKCTIIHIEQLIYTYHLQVRE